VFRFRGTRRGARRPWEMVAKRCLLAAPLLAFVAGCDRTQNALAPKSHQASAIASLFWWMMGGAWIGLALVVGLLLVAWRRPDRRGVGSDTDGLKPGEQTAWRVVVGLGIVTPIVLIAMIFVIGDLFVIRTTQASAANSTRRTVLVIGHMLWWEVRYPGTPAVTANELHIPVDAPVRLEVQTRDVIHSFWVPRLNRTIDTIPGRTNAIELYADAPGRYRGQCDECCVLQHAHMAFYAYADPPAAFHRWLANQSKPVATPPPKLFDTAGCADCHTLRGTNATADVGPDLTHVGSRATLAALTIPNDKAHMEDWILDNQSIKPGNQMPNTQITRAQARALAAYLEGLK
jgi:cytochrome c oxidase subunit 2